MILEAQFSDAAPSCETRLSLPLVKWRGQARRTHRLGKSVASTLPTPGNLFLTSDLSSRSYVYLCMNAVQVSVRKDRVSLKDGSELGIRCVNASDRDSLTALYDRLSQHSRYQRFFACPARLPAAWADMLVEVLPERRFGLVAEVLGEPPRVIAIVNCTISPDRRWAEVGLLVEDAWQDRGLGGVL